MARCGVESVARRVLRAIMMMMMSETRVVVVVIVVVVVADCRLDRLALHTKHAFAQLCDSDNDRTRPA